MHRTIRLPSCLFAQHPVIAHRETHRATALALLLMLVCGYGAARPAAAQPAPAQPSTEQATALERAHAHNDYEHARPLLGALEAGFNSVEVDIYLVDGELLVAHELDEVEPQRTLEGLYLAPLRHYAQTHDGAIDAEGIEGGSIHAGRPPLLLLIDVKSEAEPTYARLRVLLRRYADILTLHAGAATVEGAVTVVLSGERARTAMLAEQIRFAAFDGRLPDLEASAGLPSSFMPLVSAPWSAVSKWDGEGEAPPELRGEVARLAGLAHRQGRRLRFWGTPEREAVWRVLLEAGVDLIGTDDVEGLRAFLLSEAK